MKKMIRVALLALPMLMAAGASAPSSQSFDWPIPICLPCR
jgi:hypothetical protein